MRKLRLWVDKLAYTCEQQHINMLQNGTKSLKLGNILWDGVDKRK
jgi:hypothetical protein